MSNEKTMRIVFGPFNYEVDSTGSDPLLILSIVARSLRDSSFPIYAVQSAFDLYGLSGYTMKDGCPGESLNEHRSFKELKRGQVISIGSFSLTFKRKAQACKALGRPADLLDRLAETGKAFPTGNLKGLTVKYSKVAKGA